MKILYPTIMSLALCLPVFAHSADRETPVRQTVEAFYAAFDKGFVDGASAFATEDWNHVLVRAARERAGGRPCSKP